MNSKVFGVFTFIAGAAIGSLVTWKVTKTKYEQIAKEEIESVKEVFTVKKNEESSEEAETEPEPKSKAQEYVDRLNELKYGDAEDIKEEGVDVMRPYVISPDEFAERDGYDTVSLTYYEDGILTDEEDNPIKDIDTVVGIESLSHFGEYEDDSVFVRNDDLKLDFEILRDVRKYQDIRESMPVRQLNWWDTEE